MGRVAELITMYTPRFRPAPDLAGTDAFLATLGQFCAAVRELGDVEAEIADGLRGLLSDHDSLQVMLWVRAASEKPTVGLVGPLCDLLSVRDKYLQHEWVAEILGEIGSPLAIPALSDACSFDVSGDPFRSLPKRCLEALATIGTPEAMSAIRSQLSSPWPEVREEAAEFLAEVT
jgi:HEAT repeat protein